MRSRVSEKGQVTIPKVIRDRLAIRPGEVLEFDEQAEGQIVARKIVTRDPVDEVYGILDASESSDEFIDRLRGKADGV